MTFKEIDEMPERRVLASIVLQAIEDLGKHKEEILEDDEGNIVTDAEGEPVRYNVGDDAYKFLSGQTKSLKYICSQLDLKADVIKRIVKEKREKLRYKLKFLTSN